MNENLENELLAALRNSEYKELVRVEFQDRIAKCYQVGFPRPVFEKAVGALADLWRPIADKHGYSVGNGVRICDSDNNIGIWFYDKNKRPIPVMPNMNKCIRFLKSLVALIGIYAAAGVYAADYELEYSLSSNVMSPTGEAAWLKGISPLSYSGTVTIPGRFNYDGSTYVVCGLNSGAFSGSSLSKLYVPDEVFKIRNLGTCTSLKKIVLRTGGYKYSYNGDTYFDKNAFSGTHPDCIVYVPKGFSMWENWETTKLKPGDYLGGRPIEWFHYHVKFNANGGSGNMSEQKIYTDETTNLTANAYIRNGYSFAGWATSSNGPVGYSDKASVKNLDTGINATVNLYAVWENNSYTVKFNANGGTGTMANQSFVYGTAQNLAANGFSRDGYSFVGWATSANGTKVYSDKESVKNLTSTANGTVNLYAVWEVDIDAIKLALGRGDKPAPVEIDSFSGRVSSLSHDGVSSYCGQIYLGGAYSEKNDVEVLSTRVMGPCTIAFYWAFDYDGEVEGNGKFYVDGGLYEIIEGVFWHDPESYNQVVVNLGKGEHNLSWTGSGLTGTPDGSVLIFIDELEVIRRIDQDGEEPGDGEVPQGGISKFDATVVYDGKGHTIDTNALLAVTVPDSQPVFSYALTGTGPWQTDPFVFTNTCVTSFWYRISAENYSDYIHAARVTITKRDATLTSGSSTWVYDGKANSNDTVTVEGFVDGEGITVGNFATITDVGSKANAFDYAFKSGTLEGNYDITCVTGVLTVTSANINDWTDQSKWSVILNGDAQKYDGQLKTCDVTAISYDGVAVPTFAVSGNTATDAGDYTLTVAGIGNFSGSHTFKWSIAKREVTLTSGSASKVYDGSALVNRNVTVDDDGFVDGEGASFNVTSSQTNVGESENVFTYTLNDNTKAGNYNITTVNGRLTVTKANVGSGTDGGEEPGDGGVSQGGFSKFDASFVYDGEGHIINTNELVAVFGNAMVGASAIEYAVGDGAGGALKDTCPTSGWISDVPVYTNAGEYIVWYRVTNPNYNDFTHAAKLSITKRDVTLTSGSASWMYDGVVHSNAAVMATGFVDGEGVTTNNFATIQNIGTVANAFDYAFINGTLAENYNVTCVTGTLSVVSAQMDEWTDESKWAVTLLGNDVKYDGTEKTCEVAAIAYDGFSIPTYTVTGNKATDAGDYTLTVAGIGNFSGSHMFKWSIAKREVTLTSRSASKVYDGTALVNGDVTVDGDGFVDGEGASYNVAGSQTNVGESENTFSYTLNDNTKASNYAITTVNGKLTVTKANVGGGTDGGEEPGDGEVHQGGISKFDASFAYDGKGHTIDTNALKAAFSAAMIGGSAIEYTVDDGSLIGGRGAPALPWGMTVPVYTNAGEYVVWYRVTNPNYNEFVHAAKVTITPRTGVVVDIVGNVATNMYNGAAQSIDGYTVAINDSLYKETDFEFVGNSTVAGAAAGKYPMGLLASQFSNKNKNFADVTFNVMDGELVILEPAQKNVILDAIGGTFADGTVVTQECEDVYIAFPVATREGYVFDGWYLGVTNGAPKATVGAELLTDDDHTLFAKWSIDDTLMPGGASIFAWEAIDANTARIIGFKDASQKVSTLILPDMIEGRFVTEIAVGAFANSKSGITKIVLPMFCTKIGDKAFTGVASLSEIVFADVRRWDVPSESAMLSIGRYAFSGAGIEAVKLPKAVGVIGDYAFANCRKLANLTILGNPTIGVMPLRRAGLDIGGVTVHLDPALANDSAYMETLKQECGNVTVRADAIVTRMTLSSLAMSASEIELSVSVEKAASWGKVDTSLVKVAYRESLSEKPIMLGPSSVMENADGSLTVKVVAPKGNSGFFQVVLENK